jgi:quinol monooxygenase YgiN
MEQAALYVRLEAKPGKESEAADFLREALTAVQGEPMTTTWYALQFGPSTFAIFDAFPSDEGKQAHLAGEVARALLARAPELFAGEPSIETASVLAVKHSEPPPQEKAVEPGAEEKIAMQVGSELRIHQDGAISLGNPEIEVALFPVAADAMLSYRHDPKTGEHYIRLLDPVADRSLFRKRRP